MNQIIKYLGLYGLYVLGAHVIDGPWKTWDKGKIVDEWTLMHLVWGALAARMGISFKTFMALGIANELGEEFIRRTKPDWTFGSHETFENIIADIAANAVGYLLARK